MYNVIVGAMLVCYFINSIRYGYCKAADNVSISYISRGVYLY